LQQWRVHARHHIFAAVKLKVADTIRLHTIDLQTRMPFRYGIATLTALPHLFLELHLEIDGKAHRGLAAENLAPKWFTKNPDTTPQQDIDELLTVIRAACAFAEAAAPAGSVYELWRSIYDEQSRWGGEQKLPPLLTQFGVSLVERAMVDAFCRATGQTFADAVRSNAFGMPEAPTGVPVQPLRSLAVRHTVGLLDPLTDAEIPPQDKLDDGLPQSLEACIGAYGLTRFKIKIGGDIARDTQRLRDIAALLRDVPDTWFTLDGNESYRDVESFRAFWGTVKDEPFVRSSMMFIEQPLHRDIALTVGLERWSTRPPIIIDESDAELDSLSQALTRGYAGTSFKSCKGIFKAIANKNLARRSRHSSGLGIILSAEDLTTIGPVSLMQDLAVVATLGISDVERNGHHYFRGLSMFPQNVQQHVLHHHGDLYCDIGFPTLDIRGGAIAVGSVVDAPFGRSIDLDLASNFREIT
jgi:L-alanine-DL-glutamate epimerase-like enolase superfamily enzyme